MELSSRCVREKTEVTVTSIPADYVSDPVPENHLENYSRFFLHSHHLTQFILKKNPPGKFGYFCTSKSVRSQIHAYSYLTAALKGGETSRLTLNSPLVEPQHNE